MNQFLSGVDRVSLIKGTALYLIIYAVFNACGGVALSILSGLAAGAGISGAASGLSDTTDATGAFVALTALGGLTALVAVLFLISVPVFAFTAWGLWNRKRWARIATVIALGFSFVLSLLTIATEVGSIVWLLISGVGIYLYLTDEGIRQVLSE